MNKDEPSWINHMPDNDADAACIELGKTIHSQLPAEFGFVLIVHGKGDMAAVGRQIDMVTVLEELLAEYRGRSCDMALAGVIGKATRMSDKMPDVALVWGCAGLMVLGTGLEALAAANALHTKGWPSHQGELIVRFGVELTARGVVFGVTIPDGHTLKHVSCGRLYLPNDWHTLPLGKVKAMATNGKEVDVPSHRCGCGDYATYSALELGHVDDGCNAKGGAA